MKLNLALSRLTQILRSKRAVTAFTFIFLLGISSLAIAQSNGKGNNWKKDPGAATITTDYLITLDASQPLQHFYEADISHLPFSNNNDAKDFFKDMNDPAWTINVDWRNEHVIHIILRPNELTRNWTVDQWSMRLQEKAQQL